MSVLINFKICDNSKDCNGIKVCPIGAFYWDEKQKTIAIDNEKCISCGKCEESCSVGAIRVAKDEEEFKRIKKEIDKDPRKISDLFVDRYGAVSVFPPFLISTEEFDIHVIQSTKLAIAELFTDDSIKCLLHSIPIKDLFKDIDALYRKVKVQENDRFLKKYEVKELPALLFFKNGKLIGKIEGHYNIGKKEKLLEKVNSIISKHG